MLHWNSLRTPTQHRKCSPENSPHGALVFQSLFRAVSLVPLAALSLQAQLRPAPASDTRPSIPVSPASLQPGPVDSSALSGLRWRELGAYRGGRSVAVGGSAARASEYYMGTVGGGVLKSVGGGRYLGPGT